MISPLLPEHHRQGREHALVFSVEASLNFLSRPYVAGVSTRKVDALVAALGSQSGISKSQVSRICADIDVQVQAFLSRPLDASGYAYLYLDATYLHGRLGRAMQV